MRNFYRPPVKRKFYITNYKIDAITLRVIDEKGLQIGVISKEEALKKAFEEGRDLVLIAPRATPPVAKLIDFKKFLYQEEKKEQEAKRGIKKSSVKDIKLSLFIATADLNRLVAKGKEFLENGSQVRLNLVLRGRENAKRDMAFTRVRNVIAMLGDVNVSKEPRLEGKVIRAVVARKK